MKTFFLSIATTLVFSVVANASSECLIKVSLDIKSTRTVTLTRSVVGSSNWAELKQFSNSSQFGAFTVCRKMVDYMAGEGANLVKGCNFAQYDCNENTIYQKMQEYYK